MDLLICHIAGWYLINNKCRGWVGTKKKITRKRYMGEYYKFLDSHGMINCPGNSHDTLCII